MIDYYVSGWSGVPSANLEARVKNSLSEVTPVLSTVKISMKGFERQEALKRRGSSFDEKRLSGRMRSGGSRGISLDSHDLISLHEELPEDKPSPEPVEAELGEKESNEEEFLQLFHHQLVGLYVTGWVRKSLVKRVTGVQLTTVATGALGYLANKGIHLLMSPIKDFCRSHLCEIQN